MRQIPVRSEEAYLYRLGNALLYFFPAEQVREIITDYQEHFALGRERGGAVETMISALGPPETVASDLLREMPEGRSYFCRHIARWGGLLLLACAALILRYSTIDALQTFATYFFLLAGPVSLFALLRGPERAEVEGRFLQPAHRPKAVLYLLPVLAVLGVEVLVQGLLLGIMGKVPYLLGDSPGRQCGTILECCQLGLLVLLVWTLRQSWRVSVRYFPAAVHTAGGVFALREIRNLLTAVDLSATNEDLLRLLSLCALPYLAGLLFALLFLRYIRKTGEKGA